MKLASSWFFHLVVVLCLVPACGDIDGSSDSPGESSQDDGGGKPDEASGYNELNLAAGRMVIYEVQVRSANACHPEVGASWQREACRRKIAPTIPYRAEGMSCNVLDDLQAIRLGTLDDMLEDTSDFRSGITVRYIDDQVGANTIWLMPLFPNNDTWNIPDACDTLGSPYAVRDYFHVRGTLARDCIRQGRDEYSTTPCWGNGELEELIAEAHGRGMKVLLDLALNHFGHNYLMYDYSDFLPVRERIARDQSLEGLWDFETTFDASLLHPEILDTPGELNALVARSGEHRARLDALQARCPDLSGQDLVLAYNLWRDALDWEREQFPCDALYLENAAPGFYLGANQWDPSSRPGDHFTNNWRDVKFLFHHESNLAHRHEFIRQREYLFRIINYWVSRGVDAFRLDHATDGSSGLEPNEWDYILSKVNYYAFRRGQAMPVYLAEEFHHQQEMSRVVDVMTEGYIRDMCGRSGVTKDATHVEWVLANMDRFGGHTYVMTALETHDEERLTHGTGFDTWTGAGFWGIGAATWSTPMLLMGQEFGEPWGLAFRRPDFLRSRFIGSANYNPQADDLVAFYHDLITRRLAQENRGLIDSHRAFLRTRRDHLVDPRILAMVKWSSDGNVVFAFHNLWEQYVTQSYYLPPDLAGALSVRDDYLYALVDVFTGSPVDDCRTGADLKWDLYVEMDAATRLQWLRLERCLQ